MHIIGDPHLAKCMSQFCQGLRKQCGICRRELSPTVSCCPSCTLRTEAADQKSEAQQSDFFDSNQATEEHMVPNPHYNPAAGKTIVVNVITDLGTSISHRVTENSSISMLKNSLVASAKCNPESMILIYLDNVLKNDDIVHTLDIQAGDNVRLFVRVPSEFDVFVYPSIGEKLRITLSINDTASDLLSKVNAIMSIRDSVRLTYKGELLQNDVPLASLKPGASSEFRLTAVSKKR